MIKSNLGKNLAAITLALVLTPGMLFADDAATTGSDGSMTSSVPAMPEEQTAPAPKAETAKPAAKPATQPKQKKKSKKKKKAAQQNPENQVVDVPDPMDINTD
jgi:outer membrane biosynthesis protein TonB